MPRFHFGQIVNVPATISGKHKVRPAVIIDADGYYSADDVILVVFIFSEPSRPIPYYHVKVHDSFAKHPDTGLSKPCWAKCNVNWEIPVSGIGTTSGYMPVDLLRKIVDTYELILDKGSEFDDWEYSIIVNPD